MGKTTGIKNAKTATVNAGQGAKSGMAVGPVKPSKMLSVAKPVVRKDPITGVGKTNPKAQPMYGGKQSQAADSTEKIGTGLLPVKGNGRLNEFSDQNGGSGRRLYKGGH